MVARARQAAVSLGVLAAVCCLALVGLTYTKTDLFASTGAGVALWGAVALFVGAYIAAFGKRYGLGFILSSLTVAFTTIAFFWGLFPRLMVSSLNPAWSLTISNASSTPYTLSVMTVAALALVPVVLVYQGWVYWIFRKRVTAKDLEY